MKNFLFNLVGVVIGLLMAANYANAEGFEDFEWDEELFEEDGPGEAGENFFDKSFDRVYIKPEFLDGDILKLSVVAEDIATPVLGLAFHLKYDSGNVTFLRYDPGDFLERGGDPFYLVKDNRDDQKIIFGETLRRDDRFPVGGGMVVDFYFQILNWNKFAFQFKNAVISTLDSVRQDLDKILWEDLFLDRNFDERLAGSFEDGFGDGAGGTGGMMAVNLGSSSSFNLGNDYKIFFLAALAIAVFLTIIFFIKKHGKKRHVQSVNFK